MTKKLTTVATVPLGTVAIVRNRKKKKTQTPHQNFTVYEQ